MGKRIWLTWLVVMAVAMPTAQTYANISEAAVLFLRIASGARPAGMGEAFVALSDDATATHWNPAGLGRYPLSPLWLDVPLPGGYSIADFAVVENNVPERNYTRYDLWVLTEAESGYWISGRVRNPDSEPFVAPSPDYSFMLAVDGSESGPFSIPIGTYESAAELVAAVQGVLDQDEILSGSGVRAEFVPDGDNGQIRIVSKSEGVQSAVTLRRSAGTLPEFLSGGRSIQGVSAAILRATPPGPFSSPGKSSQHEANAAMIDDGIWETGDEYEPDATENLVELVASRTGLPEGADLDLRVQQVALLNQYVSTDSLRAVWNAIGNLPDAVIGDSLIAAFETLFRANDVLNTDAGRLASLLEEADDILKAGALHDDAAYRLQILTDRAVVSYLPEKLRFPLALNLPGDVTSMVSRGRSIYLGTTRGLIMYSDGRSLALNDTTAGAAADVIHDVGVEPSGALWVATDAGVSRYTSTWRHYGTKEGWTADGCERLFVLGQHQVYAFAGSKLLKYDDSLEIWKDGFYYETTLGDRMERLPDKLFGIEDSEQAAAIRDSLVLYGAMGADELEAGTQIKIPYHLAFRGSVTAMARTANGTLWIGTDRGLVSVGPDARVKRFGYTKEKIESATTVHNLAAAYLESDDAERIERLARRIKADNSIEGDTVAAGRVIEVFSGVTGSAIFSLFTEGTRLLVGTEYGMVEHDGKDKWYRFVHNELENRKVVDVSERSGERWFAAGDRVTVYAHPRKEVTFMHVKWLPTLADDLYYEFLGGVFPISGWGTIGTNLTFLSLGRQTRTDEFGNLLGDFGTFEVAATVSYGTKLANRLAAGVSAKIIHSHLSDQGAGQEQGRGTATGLAVDLGGIWQTPLKNLDLGLAITNLGPSISYIDAAQADPLPRNLAFGLAYRILHSPYNRLTFVADMNKDLINLDDKSYSGEQDPVTGDSLYNSWLKSQYDEMIFNTGLEYQYGSFIALRVGYIYDRQGSIKKPTLGAGVQYRNFLFDFAYIPSSEAAEPLDNTTRLSLSLRW